MIVQEHDNRPIILGRIGENESRKITFYIGEIKKAFPDATYTLLNKRPSDNVAYPVANTYLEVSGNHLIWTLQSGDLTTEGIGECQIKASESGKIIKTLVWQTITGRALDGSGTPPEPWESWIEEVTNAAEAAENARDEAEAWATGGSGGTASATNNAAYYAEQASDSATAAETAQGAAEDARDAAQAAAGDFQGLTASASGLAAGATPTVNVTHSSGGLYNLAFGIPKGDKGDQGDPAPAASVATAVDAYLDEHITNPDSPPLDRTLSSSSAAAPADMVGELKSALNGNHTYTPGYLLRAKNTGMGFEWAQVGTPTDAQVDSAVSDWLDDHPEATTTVQDGAITYAKFNNAVKVGITCSALGMTTADNNGDNFQILVEAINAGKTVLVDGKYDMNFDKDDCAEITEDVNLIGITPNAEFVFKTGKNAFAPTGDIDITIMNVTFDNQISLYKLTLFYVAPADATNVLLKKIYVDGCTFKHTGNQPICFMDYETTVSTAPSATFGINQLIFTHNFCDNVRAFFFRLIGQPIRRAEIIGNNVHNHDHVLYYAAISNSDVYDHEIKLSREILVIRDNYVKNDDDYFCNTAAENYCCLALSESNIIYFINNHYEGVHSDNNCTLIDVYMSGEYNYYVGNRRINCAVFTSDVSSASIFRCKGTRQYSLLKDNVFIIEDGYAARVGRSDVTPGNIFILSSANESQRIDIEDNFIYAQSLYGMEYRCQMKDFTLCNNVVIAKTWEGKALYTMSYGYSDNVTIKNNQFVFNTVKNVVVDSTNRYFFIIAGSDFASNVNNKANKIIIENNLFDFGEYYHSADPILKDFRCNELKLQNNTFRVKTITNRPLYLLNQYLPKDLVVSNQSVITPIPILFMYTEGFTQNYISSFKYENEVYATAVGNNQYFDYIQQDWLSVYGYDSAFTEFTFEAVLPSSHDKMIFSAYQYLDNGTEKIKIVKDGTVLYDNTHPSGSYQDVAVENNDYYKFIIRVGKDGGNWSHQYRFTNKACPAGSKFKVSKETFVVETPVNNS